jgi:endo-1,4-beta-xylanase
MKKIQFKFGIVLLSVAVLFTFLACGGEDVDGDDSIPVTGITLAKKTLTLGIDKSEKLKFTIAPANATNKNVTWSSDKPAIVTAAADGTVNTKASGSAKVTVETESGGFKATITVTVVGNDNIMALTPMKDQFAGKFLMGNVFNPSDITGTGASAEIKDERLTRHYNILTAENNMKPSYIAPNKGSYTYTTADNMVAAAIAADIKVVGHTLLWHSQNANWMTSTTSPVTLEDMKTYITAVVDHFKGKIYSWDVLNEVFPDGVSASADWKQVMRKAGDSQAPNPWYVAIGSDFVYEGFLAARLADPNAILYYNDYNLDNVGKATMVRDMVLAVNQKYAQEYPNANRKLIEGIGMQSHHNTNVQASSIKATLNLFKSLGVKISISELDVLAQGYSSTVANGPNKAPAAGNNLTLQATRYGEYMKVFLEFSDIIERVSLWGITDDKSWRSAGQPLLFDADGKAKPAYISFIGALDE